MFQTAKPKPSMRSAFLLALLTFAIYPGAAAADALSSDNLNFYGDFRTRLEYDWDSKRGDGAEREDRGRLRVRARLGVNYNWEEFTVGLRVRSGAEDSQQSPHITVFDFDDNPTGDADFNLDKWFFQYKSGKIKTWVGRNAVPWWHQDELVWDDDVTPAGIAFVFASPFAESGKFTVNTGVFTLPEGMRDFRGDLVLGQLVYETKLGQNNLVLAGGYLGIDADEQQGASSILLQENELRDYSTIVANVQWKMPAGGKPLTLGADYYVNTESYNDAPPGSFTDFHKNNDTGYTVFGTWGDTKDKGHWLVGVYYTHLEMLALNNSYLQDDWVRWGSATQTRASNFKGTELRAAYGFNQKLNLVCRLYIVDGIELTNPGDSSKEDGSRFRADLNFKF